MLIIRTNHTQLLIMMTVEPSRKSEDVNEKKLKKNEIGKYKVVAGITQMANFSSAIS